MQIMQLPEDFIRETRQVMGEQRFCRFMEALNEEPPTSIRKNPKYSWDVNSNLIPRNIERVPWCSEGYYLPDRPQFTFDPLFHAGCYYVQEASSMFITHVINAQCTMHNAQFRDAE